MIQMFSRVLTHNSVQAIGKSTIVKKVGGRVSSNMRSRILYLTSEMTHHTSLKRTIEGCNSKT